ncbi:MAG: PKD domain-containing protein [Myxococcota bacterium]
MWPLLVSSALAQTSPFFDVTCTPEGPTADVGPITVACEVEIATSGGDPIGAWTETQWLMGDGTVLTGDAIDYTYADEGLYTISVELKDLVVQGPDGDIEIDEPLNKTRLSGFYTICGAPRPEFDIVDKGGLNYEISNRSAVDQPRCLRAMEWTVRRQGARNPVFSSENWQPDFQVPDEGTYIVSLTMMGLGGEATADLLFDAQYNLTSDYYRVFASSCSTAPAGSAFGVLALFAVAAARRVRRR